MRAVRPRQRGQGDNAPGVTGGSSHVPIRYLVAIGLVVSVLSVAWGFAGIEGELRLRDRGLAFNDADLALDAASASRSHLGEALRVAAFGDSLSPVDLSRVEGSALTLAEQALQEFSLRSEVISARIDDPALNAAADEYLVAATALIAALRADDVGVPRKHEDLCRETGQTETSRQERHHRDGLRLL